MFWRGKQAHYSDWLFWDGINLAQVGLKVADVDDEFGLIILQDSTSGVSGMTGLCASAPTLM